MCARARRILQPISFSLSAGVVMPDEPRSPGPLLLDELPTASRDAPTPTPDYNAIHGRFLPGTVFGERYRIIELLGRGGMGEVYRGDDLELGQAVALKFLPASVAQDEIALARLRSEVRLARQISHPNVCRVFDIGHLDGQYFLSMEYVDGEDLASVLRRMGRPSREKSLQIARQICAGLRAAHENGVLHRDLKPANIMIDGRGQVRLMDFGLSGLALELAGARDFAGTPMYMAPEQLEGSGTSVRTDLFSLGVVLYEVLTGRRPFSANSLPELRENYRGAMRPPPPSEFAGELEPNVDSVILRCLDTDPKARPSSALEVAAALGGGGPSASRSCGRRDAVSRTPGRRRWSRDRAAAHRVDSAAQCRPGPIRMYCACPVLHRGRYLWMGEESRIADRTCARHHSSSGASCDIG